MRNPQGQSKIVRALIDDCSHGNFSSETLVKELHLQKHKINATVGGVGSTTFVTSHSAASFVIESLIDPQFRMTIDTLVCPKVSSYKAPSMSASVDKFWPHVQELTLADPNPYSEERIDLILGADVYSRLILGRLGKGSKKMLIAHETIFEWILIGSNTDSLITFTNAVAVHHCHDI